MKILFQGDSITNAFRRPEEINPAYQLGNGYVFLVASKLACDRPDVRHEFINRGISGNRVKDLLARWEEDTLALEPDMVSILVGVNDFIGSMTDPSKLDIEAFEHDYCQLLQQLQTKNPAIRIVLMEPFVLPVGKMNAERVAQIQPLQQCVERIAGTFRTTFVRLQENFDAALAKAPAEFWSYDGIHPTHAGFALIGEAWLKAVELPAFFR